MLKPMQTKMAGGALRAVVVATVTLGALALTQPAAASSATAVDAHRGGGIGRGGGAVCRDTGLAAAAEALNMTTDELSTQLWGGKTLADLATAAGVDLEEVQAAVNEACVAAQKTAIEQAVTDGDLTREHADWLLEGLEKGFWGQANGGFGFGRGGHEFRVRPDSQTTPTTPTGTNS